MMTRRARLERGGTGDEACGAASKPAVILDTNVLVAAGFNPESASAQVVEQVRNRRLAFVWHPWTKRETQSVLEQIPPLSWDGFSDLFGEEGRHAMDMDPARIDYVADTADRTFAALATATGAVLITHDEDLLAGCEEAEICIVTPSEFEQRSLGWAHQRIGQRGRPDEGAPGEVAPAISSASALTRRRCREWRQDRSSHAH